MEKQNEATEHRVEATTSALDDEKNNALTHRHAKEVNVQSVALADAIAKDKPDYKSKSQMTLYAMMCLCVLNGIMNGYDGSVMSAINAMDPFQARFRIGLTGELNGAVFSIYTVGSIIGSLLCGYIMDRWGRRACMFSGASMIVLGSVLQASSFQLPQFFIGRFIVGTGTPMCGTSAPVFLVEIAYPTWRGLAGGLYNVLGWYIGANMAAWTCYGTNFIPSDWAWRIPYIVQLVPATIVISVVWFLPESPRWLWSQGHTDRAAAILTKYHGDGNPRSALVKLELDEIRTSLEAEQELRNNNWNYKILVNNRPNRYRMWLIMLVAVFSQFIGGSVISYYLPAMVRGVGITDSSRQLLLNGINTVISFVSGIFGSFFVDKVGRRPLFLWGTLLTGLVYIPINVLAAKAEHHLDEGTSVPKPQAYAFIAMIFSYGIFWGFCWTPLQALYPAEILNNEIRAKGMGAKGFISGVASFINTYGTSVSIKHIGWKTYTIFLVLHFVHLGLMYMSCVETKERTLEELEEIFSDKKPVKRSLQKTTVVVDRGLGVKIKDDA
ncbi:lactose permease [Colletotrichum scovillei]|uniref:Lactose permease n=1 Tax=Colletotrichum scovillei TaxID=1209932 RepID=A0A9P7R0G8_9PEZI|nr:lactose permease [Colletotrichum scovillei]KAG7056427.1 lactose permease [Colletotrichum scovillei]KAG7066354.1 lactose permease [Colletotrichum scovillei]